MIGLKLVHLEGDDVLGFLAVSSSGRVISFKKIWAHMRDSKPATSAAVKMGVSASQMYGKKS